MALALLYERGQLLAMYICLIFEYLFIKYRIVLNQNDYIIQRS